MNNDRPHILVAVSGGIAAYKACDLVSKLSRLYDVKVMMTPNALEFVGSITFGALSHHEVFVDEFHSSTPIPHIDLAKWADVLIAAPASADLIAKAVHGIANNLVTSTFLACTCPKLLCPAMNEHMLENPVTQHNLQLAKEYGWIILDPESGFLACMDEGKGRLPDTSTLLLAIEKVLNSYSLQRDAAGFVHAVPIQASKEPKKLFRLQHEENESQTEKPVRPDAAENSRTKEYSETERLPKISDSQKTAEAEETEEDSQSARASALFAQSVDASTLRPVQKKEQTLNNIPKNPASHFSEAEELADKSVGYDEGPSCIAFSSDLPDNTSDDDILYDDALKEIKPLAGKHVLISAGPTQEDMDPVRFITNHSSGKQGYAIAEDARDWGADVILVSGPVSLPKPEGIQVVSVTSAVQMEEAMKKYADWANFIIMAAAVADYRPKEVADHKIKKSDGSMLVEFVRNPDILKALGAAKKPGQVLCGFAMETENLDANAKAKLESKNCDMLIANNLSTEGAGFQNDTNVVSLLKPNSIEHLPLQSKKELGYTILAQMLEISKGKQL